MDKLATIFFVAITYRQKRAENDFVLILWLTRPWMPAQFLMTWNSACDWTRESHHDWHTEGSFHERPGDLCKITPVGQTQIGSVLCTIDTEPFTLRQIGYGLRHTGSRCLGQQFENWHRYVTQIGTPICVVSFCSVAHPTCFHLNLTIASCP